MEAPEYPMEPAVAQAKATVFPFLKLSGETRNQIYLDIIGPEMPRLRNLDKSPHAVDVLGRKKFRPLRKFDTALFVLNHQTNQEFSDILWNVLSVEWKVDSYKLDEEELRLFTSMRRLQRCELILDTRAIFFSSMVLRPRRNLDWHSTVPASHCGSDWLSVNGWSINARDMTGWALDVELTVFGLAHRLNRMTQLQQIHLDYCEYMDSYYNSYFVRFRDGSLLRYTGADVRAVLSTELRGMKKVEISGSLCDECAALFASAIEGPKEPLPEVYMQDPETCIPRHTTPQWDDKNRGWV
ncbi:MAG: hypothetical protein LQ338_005937 [Usnochroma carphineum]|nr:MAG: hypothetical protein LQ338_005937 [Usnochroma carphineum]